MNFRNRGLITAGCALLAAVTWAETPQSAPPAKVAPAPQSKAAPSRRPAQTHPKVNIVDKLIKMVKLKMPEPTILKEAAGAKLTVDDLIALREAGASDSLINELSGASAPAARGSTPVHDPGPSPAPKRIITPHPAVANYNSDLDALHCVAPMSTRQRVIALQSFEYGANKTGQQAVLNTQASIGKGMSALAVKRIKDSGKFRVVERDNIKSVLAEQDFGASSRARQGTQAKLGRVIGADAILMGTITVFGRDDQQKTIGGGGGIWGRGLGGLKIGSKEDKAVVAIDYRLIDAETSETIAAGEARGESKRKSKVFDLGAFTGSGGGAGGYDMTSSNFAQTIIGEATIDCMNKLMDDLNSKEGLIKLRNIDDTRIADVSGAQVYLSSGGNDGIQKCDHFEVNKIVKEIHDPVTKELLDLQLEKIGDLIITEVRDKMAIGLFHGTAPPQIGYAVRKVMPDTPPASAAPAASNAPPTPPPPLKR